MSAEPITVVGMDGGELPPGAREALDEATLLLGGDLQAWLLPPGLGVRRTPIRELDDMLDELRRHSGPAVVLAPGEPGVSGILRALRAGGLTPRVLPTASTVQKICAAIGRPWDDVVLVDVAAAGGLREAVNVCRARSAVAVLTAPGAGPAEIGSGLHGWSRTLVVVENVGGRGERLTTVDAERAAGMPWQEPNVVLSLRELDGVPPRGWYAGAEPLPPADGWGLPAARFSHREGMLAAAEVRAVVLAKLAPRPGVLVWDVGAGSGAIAVECARLGAAALAVEQDPGQAVRIMANASAHNVEVCVVEDSAPGVFGMLPEPDAIFVGGGGPRVVAACTSTGAGRIVVATTDVTRVGACRDALYDNGFDVDSCQLSIARFDGPRPTAAAPVFLLTGTRQREATAAAPQ